MLKIRLRQQGRKNSQTYRLVVTDIRNPRDGKYLEMVGWYNPTNAAADGQVNAERISYWMDLGARLSPSAETLVARLAPHVIQERRSKDLLKQMKKSQKRRQSKQKTKEV